MPLTGLSAAAMALLARLLLDSSQPPDIGGVIQQLSSQFVVASTQLLIAVDTAMLQLSKLAYVTTLLVGILLYFTRLQRRMGRELIAGGVILAVLAEVIYPMVIKV